jgi:hypothetical protein
MYYNPYVVAWMTLLNACEGHDNVEVTKLIAKQVLELEPKNIVGYVLLLNIYVDVGNMHFCEKVE